MHAEIIQSKDRGSFDHGWLKTFHSFSFADYYDPKHINFGTLRVVNDDLVEPHNGFGMHPHQNMEIITIPLSGSLQHEDSMGSKGVITAGEVQVMSAGTGIVHSEKNPADVPVNLLQIWIFTNQKNVSPRYEQKKFDEKARIDNFQLLVSPDGRNNSLWIHQDAFLSRIKCLKEDSYNYSLYEEDNGVFLFVIEGSAEIDGKKLNRRDSISVTGESNISIKPKAGSEFLIIEIPLMHD
jgi:redox-sensitive bicupin YhaK (pirin superfamily)